MTVSLIAACAGEKQVIGRNGAMPWHYSSELQFFKKTTMGHPVLMGRVTYQAILKQIGKPLPGRAHLVITRDPGFTDARVQVFHDIQSALDSQPKDAEVMVAGGQQIYEQTLPLADKIYLTRIARDIEGDAFFPPINMDAWQLAAEDTAAEHDATLRFCQYTRKDRA
ncbi:MAG: hypothetical protein GC131_08510 [Alphaproteobacteria bacterium]|nr:hypothetical protein [Alphaproteobacteria bacterium]